MQAKTHPSRRLQGLSVPEQGNSQLSARKHTREGKDFISNVDGGIMLSLVERLLPPASQVLVHLGRPHTGLLQEKFQ